MSHFSYDGILHAFRASRVRTQIHRFIIGLIVFRLIIRLVASNEAILVEERHTPDGADQIGKLQNKTQSLPSPARTPRLLRYPIQILYRS